METIAKELIGFVAVPISNWYKGLSDKMRTFVNNAVTILVGVGLFWGVSTYVISTRLAEFDEKKTEIHENGTIQRIDAQTSVYNNLQLLMSEVNCKRACVIELHNGVNNPTGLPYLYGEMTYEHCADGNPFIADMFQKITVSTYKMGIYMHHHYEFFGTTEDLKDIDKKFYSVVKAQGSNYIGVVSLHNKNKIEIGFLVITFDCEKMSEELQRSIIFKMAKYGNYISSDLTMDRK